MPSDVFASIVAQTVSANAESGSIQLVPGVDFKITSQDASSTLGTDPISFALSGRAHLVWQVDEAALASALAGRSSDAFQIIVSNFPGVESAHARIEPFWESTFPSKAADIHIIMMPPKLQ
jgi:hypothetical protein